MLVGFQGVVGAASHSAAVKIPLVFEVFEYLKCRTWRDPNTFSYFRDPDPGVCGHGKQDVSVVR